MDGDFGWACRRMFPPPYIPHEWYVCSMRVERRRTQAERRAATRHAVLEAAMACLVEDGMAGVTIAAVAAGAGVSTGAVQHHFGDKATLLENLAEHISDVRAQRIRATDVADLAPADRFAHLVSAVGRELAEPASVALIELYAAARTEPRLAEVLANLSAREAAANAELGGSLFADAGLEPEQLDMLTDLLVYASVGLGLLGLVRDVSQPRDRVGRALTQLFEHLSSDQEASS